jgi:molecular chaperone HtpG
MTLFLRRKKAGSDESAVKWSSKGEEGYAVEETSKEEHGTTITLHLKKDAEKYLDNWKVKEIVKKYSDFIEYPIKMKNVVKEPKEQKGQKEDDVKPENIEYIDVEKDETLNSQKAIWLRPAKDIKEEEYQQFFKHLSHSFEDALKHIHYSAEGTTEFKALVYIPSKNPSNMFMQENQKKNLHLYVRRIFITEECPNLLPEYLRFIDGVVDSSDLPLNVSRETLQDNPVIEKIQKNLVRKILDTLKKIKGNDFEKYTSFFKEFGRNIKEGVHTDYSNKEKLQELLLFETMKNETGKLISLKDYVDMMPEDQKEIYYIIGENRGVLENSPHLEIFQSKGYDVLFMTDPIDEFILSGLFKYADKDMKAVGKGEINLDSDKKDKEKEKKAKKEYSSLLEFIQKKLDNNVKEVRFSKRLTDSACCLVGGDYDQSPYMERMMKAMKQDIPKSKRILELNPDHAMVGSMKKLYELDSKSSKLGEFAELLYDQALLAEGSPIANPLKFSKRVSELIVLGLKNAVDVKME